MITTIIAIIAVAFIYMVALYKKAINEHAESIATYTKIVEELQEKLQEKLQKAEEKTSALLQEKLKLEVEYADLYNAEQEQKKSHEVLENQYRDLKQAYDKLKKEESTGQNNYQKTVDAYERAARTIIDIQDRVDTLLQDINTWRGFVGI